MNDRQVELWGRKLIRKLEKGNVQERRFLRFLKNIVERLSPEKNNDMVICVGGERNMGKSSFAIVCAIILRVLGLRFTQEQVYYGLEDIERAVRDIVNNRRSVYVFDEMIDISYAKDSMSALNKGISKLFTRNRKLNHCYFLCIPVFKDLDKGPRDGVVHIWIDIVWKSEAKERDKRFALAAIMRKNKNPLAEDPWGITKSKMKDKKVFSPRDHLRVLKRLPSFVGTVAFPPLPKAIEEAYESHSRESAKDAGERLISSITKKKPQSAAIPTGIVETP